MRALDLGVFGARAIPSTYSGYETFLTTLLPCLVDRGHRVTMYCRRGEVDGSGDHRGVRRVVLPALAGKQLNTLSHGVVSSLRARAAGHDVVLVVNVANALSCALNRYTGQPVVLNTDGQEWLRGKWGWAAQLFFRLSARAAKYGATGLVADCAAMAGVYGEEFGARSTVIPYCFPASAADLDPAVPARFGVQPDDYHLVAGRLNPENNIDAVARAYARSTSPAPLLVLGAANYESPVKHRLEELARRDHRIRLVGHVSDRQAFLSLLAHAATYLHGHSVGGMNPSLVEAMGAGALVAALDTVFNRETLGEAGRYFAPDCSDLGQVLDGLAALPPDERDRRRRRAADRVRTRFAVKEVVDAYEAVLTAAAHGPVKAGLVVPTPWAEP
ncbi:MAG: glycosyltransferase [Actinomycetota bacterium]|nr:glycosyltransferase [Actinomycetota bacterium]